MIETTIHIDSLKLATNAFKKVERYDPTRTTGLRNAFARAINKRFDELAKLITRTVVDQDCFGLAPKIKVNQMEAPMRNAFDFPRSSEKVAAFMKWLQRQIDRGLLEVGSLGQVGEGIEEAWTDKYILDSYKRGVQRARYEMINAGMDIPSLEATGGVTMSMFTPFHLDRVGLLYSRTFNELRGITNMMDTQISRILSQGMADGDNPRLLARKLVTTINGVGANDLGLDISYISKSGKQVSYFMPAKRRAEILARTEIIRAHHQATIQEYRNWGLLGIKVRGEWRTTNDNRVCERCAELEGHVFTLDEIEGMIPLHPQCRCVALPYIDDGKSKDKKEVITKPLIPIENLKIDDINTERLLIKQSFLSEKGERMMFESLNKQLDVPEWIRQKTMPKVVDLTVDINRKLHSGYLNRIDAIGGKGYGFETLKAVVSKLEKAGVSEFTGYIEKNNYASQNMMSKLGGVIYKSTKEGDYWRYLMK